MKTASLDNAVIVEDIDTANIPTKIDVDWNDYVLKQFKEEELFGGNPTVDGLRRVTESLIGEILETRSNIHQVPDNSNDRSATISVSIAIKTISNTGEPIIKIFDGAADAFHGNIPGKDFQKHPVAIAETRAEARALRKALRLRNVAAEELSEAKSETELELINKNQLNLIDQLSSSINGRGLNIDVTKYINVLADSKKISSSNIKNLNEEDGRTIIQEISKFQSDKSLIPKELLGYNANWRDV